MTFTATAHDQDQRFRNSMISYIREHFGDILGEHVQLLDEEGGLDKLAEMVRSGRIG